MKKILTTIVAVTALSIGSGATFAKDWKKIRIGVEGAYPPFSSVTADGKLVGFDIDIANALCKQLAAKCTMIQQDWDGIIPALMARKFDAIIASMSITEERKKKVAFSGKYYSTPAKFIRKKGSGIEITKAGLNGKTVGVQRATTHDSFLTDNYSSDVTIKRYGSQDDAFLDMTSGRVDLLLLDSVAGMDGFLKTDAGKNFEHTGPGFTQPKWFGDGAGIAIRKGDKDLVDKFNGAIQAIRDSGEYQKINAKYFDFDVWGD